MTRRKTYQKGSVKLHNSNWTLRIRELVHASGKWQMHRYNLGKFKDRKDALKAADPIIRRVNECNNSEPQKLYSRITFKDFLETHWKVYTVQAKHQISTIDTQNSLIQFHLSPVFDEKLMREVKPSDIGQFLHAKLNQKLSGSTLQMLYGLLRLMFDIAEQYDIIEKSPVRPKLHKPEIQRTEKPTLTAAEIRKVLASLSDEQERLFALLIAITGMRVGEAQALRWMDFNAEGCTVTINHTLYRQQLKAPKTESSRDRVRLPVAVAGLLVAHRGQSAFAREEDFVFCRPDGSPLYQQTLRDHLYKAMDKAEIKRTLWQYGFHIFRHSAGTLLYKKSRDLKLVQGTLRHADISTTSDIYVHLDDKVLSEGTEFLAEEILANCDLFVTQSSKMVS